MRDADDPTIGPEHAADESSETDDKWPNTMRVPKFDKDTPPADRAPKKEPDMGDPWGDAK